MKEYKIIEVAFIQTLETKINEYAKEGYQLITLLSKNKHEDYCAVMERDV